MSDPTSADAPEPNDVPHWDGIPFTDLDVRHWLPYLGEEPPEPPAPVAPQPS